MVRYVSLVCPICLVLPPTLQHTLAPPTLQHTLAPPTLLHLPHSCMSNSSGAASLFGSLSLSLSLSIHLARFVLREHATRCMPLLCLFCYAEPQTSTLNPLLLMHRGFSYLMPHLIPQHSTLRCAYKKRGIPHAEPHTSTLNPQPSTLFPEASLLICTSLCTYAPLFSCTQVSFHKCKGLI